MIPGERKAIEYLKTNPNLRKVVGFEEHINFMLTYDVRKKIQKVIKANQDVFFNESHFIRASINRNLREFDEKGRLRK